MLRPLPGLTMVLISLLACAGLIQAQSPELSMREFSSGQIKKGVRSIGFGGDGATWGNYGLVWMDANTALADYGDTHFSNGNDFQFAAVGLTTPPLWHRLAIYVIAMGQNSSEVHFNAKSPGLGPGAVAMTGKGSDTAVFSKIAMPLGKGFSAGVLLSHEISQLDASSDSNPHQSVHYQTGWRPSGGFGVAWQPDKKLLFGFRGLFNSDRERRTDSAGSQQGLARSMEFRLGGSVSPWKGALADVGATRLERRNALAATHTVSYHPNLGFEQALHRQRVVLRAGVDETSPTAGLSYKFSIYKLEGAYVYNMAKSRVRDLFGTSSNSVLLTFIVNYGALHRTPSPAPQ